MAELSKSQIKAEPSRSVVLTGKTPAAAQRVQNFYAESFKILNKNKIPFMVGGTFAINAYTGMNRETKDMDLFCKPGDYPQILNLFRQLGYKTEIEDERWIAKVKKGKFWFDIIFGSGNAVTPVTNDWLTQSEKTKIYDVEISLLPVTEMIWSKAFVQNRHRYDGGDIAHLILKRAKSIDWQRLLQYFDQYWEVLLAHIINFRFIYPSERKLIPRDVLDSLLGRLQEHMNLPEPSVKVCRGRLFSWDDYTVDIKEWGFADLIGGETATAVDVSKGNSGKGSGQKNQPGQKSGAQKGDKNGKN